MGTTFCDDPVCPDPVWKMSRHDLEPHKFGKSQVRNVIVAACGKAFS